MEDYSRIGESTPIRDAALKVTGRKMYVGDMKLHGMLYGEVLFSKVAHAKIKSIDTSEAEALPGVRAVVCYKNSPDTLYNSAVRFYEHQIPDTERVFDDTVRFVGDRVAAVAADTQAIAKKAVGLIKVEYEPLPVYLDPEEAMQEGAYPIHGDKNAITTMVHNAGDLEQGFAQADRIFEDRYTTQAVHHCAIEPHVSIADYDYSGKLTVYTSCQNTFGYRIALHRIFKLPMSRIRVVTPAIGGAFGGKLEMTLEPVAALLSMKAGRPVKVTYSRQACIDSTRTRHASVVYLKTGVKNDGTIVAQDIRIITNTGAYATSALNVLGALSHKVFKVYKIPNMRFTGIPVYTNTPIAGAMRGYGSPQAFFGQQRQFQKIAKALGMSLVDFQMKNLVNPEDSDPMGFKLGNPHPKDCVRRGVELMANWKPLSDEDGKYSIGVGMAVGAHGCGCFGAHRDQACVMLKMNEDGTCTYFTGTHDMGNGSVTAQTQVVSNTLQIPLESITTMEADTDACPWQLGDYSSHGIFVVASAAKKCAESVGRELVKEAALLLEEKEEDLELVPGGIHSKATDKTVSLSDVVVYAQDKSKREIICSETYPMPNGPTAYGAHFARVKVEKATGKVTVTDYVAVHDVGKVINRMGIEGQLHGGIQMGLGYALCEGLKYDENGRNVYNNFRKYKMFTADQMPSIQVDFIEAYEPNGPYGAKSIGEAAVVPSNPAVLNAVCDALGKEIYSSPYRDWEEN
ncbi:MAG: molybdopterin-dependent oxidoreductase [Oscillospiraceae bacterium]|nr:molybdopterin-dependent oxidoreductase [Oscillospiraceae bacterium]